MKKILNNLILICSKYIDPEKAHALALFFLKLHFLNKMYRPQSFKNLNTTFCNIKLKNPIGLAAGFDKNAEVIKGLFKLGVGLIEIGAVTPKPQYGNRKPRVFRLQKDLAIINKLGFNNFGMEKINENLKKNNSNGILGINVGANKNSQDKALDFINIISYFSNDVDYFTLNISSPNTYGLRDFQNKKKLNELLKRIDENTKVLKIKKPVLLKISPDLENDDLRAIVELSIKYKIAGIVATNTTVSRKKKLKSPYKLEEGGLSGKPLFDKSNIILAKLYFLTEGKMPLIGVGGVFSGKDAYKKICIGATVVQLYTAFTFRGPLLFNKILNELDILLKQDGYKNISEAVGSKNYKFLTEETDRSIFG